MISPEEATLGVRAGSPQKSCARQFPLLEFKGKEVASVLSINGFISLRSETFSDGKCDIIFFREN